MKNTSKRREMMTILQRIPRKQQTRLKRQILETSTRNEVLRNGSRLD